MSVQYDFTPGFDLSSVTSATQAQVMQALSQMAPLNNIGGIVASATAPDITNNPRFTRYIWVDISDPTNPVSKLYNGTAWTASILGNYSVISTMLANYAVSIFKANGVDGKIALRENATADPTKAGFIVRVDINGQFVETVSHDTILQANPINPARFDLTGASSYSLLSVDNAGVSAFRAFDPVNMLNDGSIPTKKVANATPYFIIGASAAGVMTAQQFDPANMISVDLQDASRIGLNKLKAGAAVANDIIYFNGVDWTNKAPAFNKTTTSADKAMTAAASQILAPTAHNLGVVPTNIGIYFVSKANDAATGSYPSGSIIPLSCVVALVGGAVSYPIVGVSANANDYSIYQKLDTANTIGIFPNGGGAILTPTVAQFIADFNVRVILSA